MRDYEVGRSDWGMRGAEWLKHDARVDAARFRRAAHTHVACLLYHTPSMELVARTVTLHLDTYPISAGKVL